SIFLPSCLFFLRRCFLASSDSTFNSNLSLVTRASFFEVHSLVNGFSSIACACVEFNDVSIRLHKRKKIDLALLKSFSHCFCSFARSRERTFACSFKSSLCLANRHSAVEIAFCKQTKFVYRAVNVVLLPAANKNLW